MKKYQIAVPCLGEEEVSSVGKVIESGWVTQGPKTVEFENNFAEMVGAKHAVAVSNCTAGLHLSLLAVGVGFGDVVITVSHSFIATANSVRHCGAEPYFVDIERDTLNMFPSALKKVLEEEFVFRDGEYWLKDTDRFDKDGSPLGRVRHPLGRLGAILVVHQVGMPANMAEILPLAETYNVPVIEDGACAIGSQISMDDGKTWKPVGSSQGSTVCFSFHPRKVLTTGDGGMVTTNDADIADKLRLLRQHGMSVSDLARHSSSKVVFESYDVTGYNVRLTDIQSSVGIEQLKRLPELMRVRKELAAEYATLLCDVEGVVAPVEPAYARTNWQSYVVQLVDKPLIKVMEGLLEEGIASRRGIMNAHLEAPYSCFWEKGSLPASEDAQNFGLILPLHHLMKPDDCRIIVGKLKNILNTL